jgi:choline dehydrogenase-like flavoprotein
VIAGSGAGGAAAARTLARKGLKVLVLEEGGRFSPAQFSGRNTAWSLSHLYRDRGLQTFEGDTIGPLVAGRAVGGSTVINSAICFRARAGRLEAWRRTGLSWMTDARMAALYDDVEQTIGVVDTHPFIARRNNLVFLEGAKNLGLKCGFMRRNAPGCVGCGVCHLGCPTGGKSSVDRNFLAQAEEAGAVVVPRARAAQLRMEGSRCTGLTVELLDEQGEPAGPAVIHAKYTILSAGTVGTALILLKNSVGGPHVGQHLAMHPGVAALGRFDHEIRPWSGVPQGAWAEIPNEPNALLETFNVTLDIYYRFIGAPGAQGLERMKYANHVGSSRHGA